MIDFYLDEVAQMVGDIAKDPDPTDWLNLMFGASLRGELSPHQYEFWQWIWRLRLNARAEPYIAIWSRGHGKSSTMEAATVTVGALEKRFYVLYVSSTQQKANKHIHDIASLMSEPNVAACYPSLSKRKVNKYGHSEGWTRDRLTTQRGFIAEGIGLDVDVRGLKWDYQRPDLIFFDDIDELHDTPDTTKKKRDIIMSTILPAGAANCSVVGAQNLIKSGSIFSDLANPDYDGMLADRIVSGPYPAIKNLTYERRKDRPGWEITGGTPTWSEMTIEVCQQQIDTYGLPSFLSECQHELSRITEGYVFNMYNEIFHVVTKSELIRAYREAFADQNGNFMVPPRATLGRGQDWGTTEQHPCLTEWLFSPFEGESQVDIRKKDEEGRNILVSILGDIFLYRELCVPDWLNITKTIDDEVWPSKIAKMVHSSQNYFNEEARIKKAGFSYMSHERTDVLNTYIHELKGDEKVFFKKWKATATAGIPQLQEFLSIDPNQYHPFRRYPKGHLLEGQPLRGKPRFYILVDDGQGELYIGKDGRLRVQTAFDSKGMARIRWELPIYKYRRTAKNVEIDKVDQKIDDDAIDALRGVAQYFFLPPGSYNSDEILDAKLPTHLQNKNVAKIINPEERSQAEVSRNIQLARVKNAIEAEKQSSLKFLKRRKK